MSEELRDQQHEDDNFPRMEVHVDQSNLEDGAIDTLFRALLELDIDQACAVISEEPNRRGTFGKDPYIIVTVADNGLLDMALDAYGVFLHVHIDPTKFDLAKPKHEDLLQRCAALVQAIHESPITGEEREGNPSLYPFEFWKWSDIDPNGEMPAKWAHLAEVWAAARQ